MRTRAPAIFVAFVATSVGGCDKRDAAPSTPSATPNTSVAAAASSGPPVVNAIPAKDDKVRLVVNPRGRAPYSGPVGTIRGTVTAVGDQAPILDDVSQKIPDKCKGARLVYGRRFREGMLRSLADVLVAVTGYDGFVPAKSEAVRAVSKDCAWDSRTYVLTYGQRIDVVNEGPESHLPRLVGDPLKAVMVAIPKGDPVKIYPSKPGRFALVDQMSNYMSAEVFVLKYPTAAVTGLDGKFEITGIPVGEVKVNAMLPSTNQVAEKTVKIEAGKTVDVNLEIRFDKKTMEPKPAPKPKSEVVIQ